MKKIFALTFGLIISNLISAGPAAIKLLPPTRLTAVTAIPIRYRLITINRVTAEKEP